MESIAEASSSELVALARISLGESQVPRTPEFWDWKHRANPFGASMGLVARAPEALAGMRAFMRWTWRSDGGEHPAVRAVDTATHPDWRERGIFRTLTEAALEEARQAGIHFIFNTPNHRSLPGYLKMGWKQVGRIQVRVRPFRPLRSVARIARDLLAGDAPVVTSPPNSAEDVLGSLDLEPYLASFSGEERLHTPREARYLVWRYASVPGLRYGAAIEGAPPRGTLVVYRLRERAGLLELMICEVLVGSGTRSCDAGARLLRRLGREVDADYAVAVASSRTPEGTVLSRARFLTVPRIGPVFVVRPVAGAIDPSKLFQRESWRLSVGDIELF